MNIGDKVRTKRTLNACCPEGMIGEILHIYHPTEPEALQGHLYFVRFDVTKHFVDHPAVQLICLTTDVGAEDIEKI